MIIENLPFKILKKLNFLPYINTSKRVFFGCSKIRMPVVSSLGYPNLFLKPNWLSLLINDFFVEDDEGFIDVGANIGQTLIAVKVANCKINYIGFEPSISCCYYLKRLISENKFADCQVYNFALSDRLKPTFLGTNAEADPTGSLVENLRPDFFTRRESIFALDYDSLKLDQRVACIKIDVEGGELEVLMGMQTLISQNRPYILCEILDSHTESARDFTQNRADQVCELLRKQAYSIIQIVQNEQTDRIISFTEIDTVKIRQWDKDSIRFNDYIFCPNDKLQQVREILTKHCR